jgi:hypothetical protein
LCSLIYSISAPRQSSASTAYASLWFYENEHGCFVEDACADTFNI